MVTKNYFVADNNREREEWKERRVKEGEWMIIEIRERGERFSFSIYSFGSVVGTFGSVAKSREWSEEVESVMKRESRRRLRVS